MIKFLYQQGYVRDKGSLLEVWTPSGWTSVSGDKEPERAVIDLHTITDIEPTLEPDYSGMLKLSYNVDVIFCGVLMNMDVKYIYHPMFRTSLQIEESLYGGLNHLEAYGALVSFFYTYHIRMPVTTMFL